MDIDTLAERLATVEASLSALRSEVQSPPGAVRVVVAVAMAVAMLTAVNMAINSTILELKTFAEHAAFSLPLLGSIIGIFSPLLPSQRSRLVGAISVAVIFGFGLLANLASHRCGQQFVLVDILLLAALMVGFIVSSMLKNPVRKGSADARMQWVMVTVSLLALAIYCGVLLILHYAPELLTISASACGIPIKS